MCTTRKVRSNTARNAFIAVAVLATACGSESLLEQAPATGMAVQGTHSWGSYHWARTTTPFTLKLGDNVSTAWDPYLAEAARDWDQSSVLDMAIVAGKTGTWKACQSGREGHVEICNKRYGFNGWLGVAAVWADAQGHIVKATVKINDSYFDTKTYNKPDWRRLVMCQEIGHTLGLDHQDENFDNPNLGTCMDYTSDPAGNGHPNAHDYEQLEMIYAHLDSYNSYSTAAAAPSLFAASEDWGDLVKTSGRTSTYVQDLGDGRRKITYVIWAN